MARNKKIPEWGLQMNKRQSHILLDGLIASDGYIRSNRVEYSTMSDILSSHVYILATRCGYRPSIIQVKTGIYIIGWSITPNNIHTGSVKSIFISKPTRVAINRGIRKDEPLYDISIEKDETLVVGGVVAHNCHRIGQEADSVTIYQLFAKGTIDQYMSELLGEKQKIFDKVMNGEVIDSPRETSLVGDLLKNIQK